MIRRIDKNMIVCAALAIGIAGTVGLTGCRRNADNQNQTGPDQNSGAYTPAPPPAPVQAYTSYYYDPDQQVYYAYMPNGVWEYYPGTPPAGAVYWSGPPPVLPAPPPGVVIIAPPVTVSFDFYFDPVGRVYYYNDPHYGWRYYPGHPPSGVHYWGGPAPRNLPPPRR